MEPETNNQLPDQLNQVKEKPKNKLVLILAGIVLVVLVVIVILFFFFGSGGSTMNKDLSDKSKSFIETYGNYSYANPGRNLDSIKSLMTTSLYGSIKGDSQDYIYTSNLRKTKFSIETKISGDGSVKKSGSLYIVTFPVNEKSTLSGLVQNENKTYSVTWSKDGNDWKISDFSTNK